MKVYLEDFPYLEGMKKSEIIQYLEENELSYTEEKNTNGSTLHVMTNITNRHEKVFQLMLIFLNSDDECFRWQVYE